jgi:CRP-like cAMP-binding protein
VHYSEGRFFADDDLLYSSSYNVSAMVDAPDTSLLLIDRSSLLELFSQDQQIALHFYWYFWKSLSFQIRQANEQLKSFFALPKGKKNASSTKPETNIIPEHPQKQNIHFELAINQKERLLKDKGIDTEELKMVAKLCSEEFYNTGEYIFREGDEGDKLYIVAAGEILISKKIDGVGDEALAILGKGEFFGEMALMDGEKRSADARAHKSGTTVLSIKKDVLKEILNMDAASACKFLTILYRLLHQRLREIREKIYQWKIMAGGF